MTALVVAMAFAWVVLPRLFQSVLAPKFRGRVGESAPATNGMANLADFGLASAVLLICLFILFNVFRDEHDVKFGALFVMVLPWTTSSSATSSQASSRPSSPCSCRS